MRSFQLKAPLRAGVCAALLAGLAACGGGGGGDRLVPLISTASVNPSSSASTVVTAVPNGTQLSSASLTNLIPGSGVGYRTVVNGVTYDYTGSNAGSNLTVTSPAGIDVAETGNFFMLCENATSKSLAVLSNPVNSSTRPATVQELKDAIAAGQTSVFERIDCPTSSPTLPYGLIVKTDGSIEIRDGALALVGSIAASDVDKYFSTTGLVSGADVHRGHIYRYTDSLGASGHSGFIIVETYKQAGVDGVRMYLD